MTDHSRKPPVSGRLVGRPPNRAGDPDGRSLSTTLQDRAALGRESRIERHATSTMPAAARAASGSAPDTGLLGDPLLGDETAGLGAAAPTQAVANDYDDPPSQRRIGESLVGDSQNFQGRPNTSLVEGGDATGAGGGSGL